jgi:hypothetical protein
MPYRVLPLFIASLALAGLGTTGFSAPVLAKGVVRQAGDEVKLKEFSVAFTLPGGYREVPRDERPPEAKAAAYLCAGPTTEGFATNINLGCDPFPGKELPSDIADSVEKEMARVAIDYKLVSQQRVKVADQDAVVLSSSYRQKKDGPLLQNRQVLIVREGKLYVFTFTSLAKVYEKQVTALDSLLKSLHWIK